MRRAQAGDRDAFEALVGEHATEVYRIAASIVGAADAGDVMQDTFVAAWQQLPKLRDDSAFRAWLRRICVNRARNWLRTARRRGPTADLDAARATADPRADFGPAAEARVLLDAAFELLSADQRAMLALHYGMGFSISESADAIGIPIGTAKSRLNAGLVALRRAVAHAPNGAAEVAS